MQVNNSVTFECAYFAFTTSMMNKLLILSEIQRTTVRKTRREILLRYILV